MLLEELCTREQSLSHTLTRTPPIFALLTDPGRVRRTNEDTCASAQGRDAYAFVVCDGMGGAAAGEVASHLASSTFLSHLTSPLAGQPVPVRPRPRLEAAVQAANSAVYRSSQRSSQLKGMGTTLVGLLYLPAAAPAAHDTEQHSAGSLPPPPAPQDACPPLWLVNVGDSRGYLFRNGALSQLTLDHSFVEEQLRAGQITAVQAATSPMRNLITRAIGSSSAVEPDIQGLRPHPREIYLLASDGLARDLTPAQIEQTLRTIPQSATEAHLQQACRALVDQANASGGNDNITVLLVTFP